MARDKLGIWPLIQHEIILGYLIAKLRKGIPDTIRETWVNGPR